jgi:hypothetical protein
VNRRAKSEGVDHLSVESFVENNLRTSSETSRRTTSGSTGSTSLQPFHLEDLPLRIKLAEGLLTQRSGMQHVEIRRSAASTITLQNSAPVRPYKRRSSNPSPFNMEITRARYTRVRKHELVLKSTNFSLTSLGYRHGDIRVQPRPPLASDSGANSTARSGLTMSHASRNQIESSTSRVENGDGSQDEELDLPGFQMAISGATGRQWMEECEVCLTDGPHLRLDELEVKVDELVKWCDDFGLDMGRLVKGPFPGEEALRDAELRSGRRRRRRRRLQFNLEVSAEGAVSMVGSLEIGQQLRINASGGGEDLISAPPYEAIKMVAEISSKCGDDKKGKRNHDSEASLPPSPMQSIGPSALPGPENFVPVGYNVDHELSDYLKWKSARIGSSVEGDI